MSQKTLDGNVKKELLKSISYSQEEIIKGIINMYCPEGIELDPTYSIGNFYKKIQKPKYKFDINPQIQEVEKADCTNLPLKDNSIKSIMFDPPFIAGIPTKTAKKGVIGSRFGSYMSIPRKGGLWEMYRKALIEFYRILKEKGILIIKCQDTISDGHQFLSHIEIINYAYHLGFYPKDLFILLAKNRIIGKTHHNQQHCRKYHSYFLVFIKQKSPVKYSLIKQSESIFPPKPEGMGIQNAKLI